MRTPSPLIVALVLAAWPTGGPARAFRPPPGPRVDLFGDPLPADCLARLGCTRLRHAEDIGALAFSPDAATLAVGAGGTVVFWDVKSGRHLKDLGGGEAAVRAVAFSPDGAKVAAVSDKLRLWDAKSGLLLRDFGAAKATGQSVAFSPDGKSLAGCDESLTARVWDVATGVAAVDLEKPAISAESVAYSPDGRWLVGAGQGAAGDSPDKRPVAFVVWDAKTGRRLREWEWAGSSEKYWSGKSMHIAFSPDGRGVAAGANAHAAVWDAATGALRWSRFGREVGSGVGFLNGGDRMVIGGPSSGLLVVNAKTGETERRVPAASSYAVHATVSADGKFAAAAGYHGIASIWRTDTWAVLHPFADTHREQIHFAAISADGKTMVSATEPLQPVLVWDVARATVRHALAVPGDPADPVRNYTIRITAVALTPDGRRAAVAVADGRLHLWDAGSGKLVRTVLLPAASPPVASLAFSPDGRRLAMTDEHGAAGCVWDAATGDRIAGFAVPGHEGAKGWGEYPLRWSPDGAAVYFSTSVMSASAGPRIHVFDPASGKHLRVFGEAGETYKCLALSPDGRLLTGTRFRSPQNAMWDAATGESLGFFGPVGDEWANANRIAYSPDGLYVAVSYGRVVSIRELATRQVCRTFPGHTRYISEVFWSPGPAGLVTTSADTTALVWDWTNRPAGAAGRKDVDPDACWAVIAGADAAKAFAALAELQTAPAAAARVADARLKPDLRRTDAQLRSLIQDVGDADAKTRESAARVLRRYDAEIQNLVAAAVNGTAAGEHADRLRAILADVKSPLVPPAQAAESRMIHLLERLATPEATRVLESVAAGDPRARLTRLAKSALTRVAPAK